LPILSGADNLMETFKVGTYCLMCSVSV
jgi:hypothetical protein